MPNSPKLEIKIRVSPEAIALFRELASNFEKLTTIQEENKHLLSKLINLPSLFEDVSNHLFDQSGEIISGKGDGFPASADKAVSGPDLVGEDL